jgi:hypothetical protein
MNRYCGWCDALSWMLDVSGAVAAEPLILSYVRMVLS